MNIGRFVGVDLAWGPSRPGVAANETGVVALDPAGRVLDAGWTRGLDETVGWVLAATAADTALAFIDAPLIVDNASGQRLCEPQVGQRYGRWKVSANTTNINSLRLAGLDLRQRLEVEGWRYSDGLDGPPGRRAHVLGVLSVHDSRRRSGMVARPRSPVGPDVRQQRRPLLERLGWVPIRSGIEKPDGLVGPNLRAERRQDIEP